MDLQLVVQLIRGRNTYWHSLMHTAVMEKIKLDYHSAVDVPRLCCGKVKGSSVTADKMVPWKSQHALTCRRIPKRLTSREVVLTI